MSLADRNRTIYELRRRGMTYRQLMQLYDFTRPHLSTIINAETKWRREHELKWLASPAQRRARLRVNPPPNLENDE